MKRNYICDNDKDIINIMLYYLKQIINKIIEKNNENKKLNNQKKYKFPPHGKLYLFPPHRELYLNKFIINR